MDAAQDQMMAAETLRQEVVVIANTYPLDLEAYEAKHAEYGAAFVNASAAVAEASYAEED